MNETLSLSCTDGKKYRTQTGTVHGPGIYLPGAWCTVPAVGGLFYSDVTYSLPDLGTAAMPRGIGGRLALGTSAECKGLSVRPTPEGSSYRVSATVWFLHLFKP